MKIAIRIAVGGKYATDSCLFEVAAIHPQLNDELLGREEDWSFFTATEMAKCRDSKNKFVRTLKSGRATVVNRRTAVPFAATTGLTASLSVLVSYTATLTNAVLASIAVISLKLGDFKLNMATVTLVVAELFAGIYQATTLYNWARVNAYMNCASKYSESDHRVQHLFETYDKLNKKMRQTFQLCKEYSSVARNHLASVHFKSEETFEEKERERYKNIVDTLYESTGQMNRLNDRFGQETKDLSFVHTFVSSFDTKDAKHRWEQKEKKEFAAEILLNPVYWLLERINPNQKYGDSPIDVEDTEEHHQDMPPLEPNVEEYEYILSHKSSPEFSRDLERRFLSSSSEEEDGGSGGVLESKSNVNGVLDVAERHTTMINEELNKLETVYWKEATEAKDRLFIELRETFEALCKSIEKTELERLQKFPFCIV